MSDQIQNTEPEKRGFSWKNSITLKMFIVGILVLVLLIPLAFVRELIREREKTRDQAMQELNQDWGSKISLYGPILKIPYNLITLTTSTDVKTGKISQIEQKTTEYAYFFPDQLHITGTVNAEAKKRGIYDLSVYQTNNQLSGTFSKPDFKALEIEDKNVQWDKTQVIFQLSNVKGIGKQLTIKIGDETLPFTSEFKESTRRNNDYISDLNAGQNYLISSAVFNVEDFLNKDKQAFEMTFLANGTEEFEVIPIGKETKMNLKSNWKDADFCGAYLPYNPDKLKPDGFDAHWQVLDMNRPFPQQFTYLPNLNEFAFGVNFMIPVDNYLQNERSAKYGYLVIALTFLLFFLIQILSKINIHPFQYLLIGLALIIFYTLLLSISEHSNFNLAYLIAGFATIVLITLFSKSIMRTWKFPMFIMISLTALYAFIFVIIQLEDYALLVGSIGLFTILATVMYASRKIEWS